MKGHKTKEKIQQLQILEQSLASISNQKQNFEIQLNEIESALSEISGKKTAFKIIGGLIFEKPSSEILSELNSKKELFEIRIKSIESQEKKMNDKKDSLQKEVMSLIEKEKEHSDNAGEQNE